ncbi:MAG: UDP-N-acetylmuramate--L-alanine ligase [Spirochaetaceae bacterium]|nr:MAG: UDP-N-acetylmuramate--L-alanine ligase [Spirochaetaceae bacterium]
MSGGTPPRQFAHLFMVGIKGTGMTALAEVLHRQGVQIVGSDTNERFHTDTILAELGIRVIESFEADQLPDRSEAVIYSAAYDPAVHPQLRRAAELGKPVISYPEALGELSAAQCAVGVAGVHGKTTTAAMIGTLVRELELPGAVLVGSAAADFGGRSTYSGGREFLVAETCEYKRHFLFFHPDILLVTGIEPDHLDYYRDMQDIQSAFDDYCRRLAVGGTLIYCADDPGAVTVCRRVAHERPDLTVAGYGRRAEGDYRVSAVQRRAGELSFLLGDDPQPLRLHVPGEHNALNAAAAVAVIDVLAQRFGAAELGPPRSAAVRQAVRRALAAFRGTRRRCEVLGEAGGVLFVDDYGHHPTAIRTTLDGLRSFYPGRRLVVDFMSHTYSRTAALLDEFARSLAAADVVVLHKIYASAREQFDGRIAGSDLAERTRRYHRDVHYVDEPMDAVGPLQRMLRRGDLFVTMGAGNNWRLGEALLAQRQREQPA